MRERIGKIATDAAAAVGYRGAGTIEGMQVGDEYFFLEMNTRVQVEHCVTEMVSGVDIVREQILVAAGEPLSIAQEDVELRGWSIECRINAEAAHKKFAPAPGPIGDSYREPSGPGVRVDSGVEAGSEVTPMYDPMVAKLIVWDVDREKATRRMLRALGEYEIGGLTTLIPFHEAILATEQWARGRDLPRPDGGPRLAEVDRAGGRRARPSRRGGRRAGHPRLQGRGLRQALRRQGDRRGRRRRRAAPAAGGKKPPKRERKAGGGAGASSEALPSPLQGTVLKVAVEQGAEVAEGDLICVIEAMKMENEITAHRAGKVTSLNVAVGRRRQQRRHPRRHRVATLPLEQEGCTRPLSRRPSYFVAASCSRSFVCRFSSRSVPLFFFAPFLV